MTDEMLWCMMTSQSKNGWREVKKTMAANVTRNQHKKKKASSIKHSTKQFLNNVFG